MTRIIDGTIVKAEILAQLKKDIKKLPGEPGLAVILVGDNPASKAYIGMKKKACESLGIKSFEFLPTIAYKCLENSCHNSSSLNFVLSWYSNFSTKFHISGNEIKPCRI